MKVAVCVKQVPNRDYTLSLTPDGRWVREEGLAWEISESDLYGIEAALQRLLREKGLSFGDVLRAARQELALHYLNESDLSLTEIALCLGYSELSAFSRAFRSWTGMNPQRFRRTAGRGRGNAAS